MKLRTVISAAALALTLSVGTVGVANAGQPSNPGCFGTDRAAFIAANSGLIASGYVVDRAGNNGSINQAYMESCGQN